MAFSFYCVFPASCGFLCRILHISMFSPRGGWWWGVTVGGGGGVRGVRDYPRELDNFEKLGSKFLTIVTKFCDKNPLNGPSNFGLITYRFFYPRHLRSRPGAKVACQIPGGRDCFGLSNPQGFPTAAAPPPRGETLIGAYIT